VTTVADREWIAEPFLCSGLPGGGAQLSLVIGYGISEARRAVPRLHEPHGFSVAWLRATAGEGVLAHRHDATQVVTAKAGRWAVRLNTGADEQVVELGRLDTLSVPPGAWRSFTQLDDGEGELLVVTGGDGRTQLDWAPEVVKAARRDGRVLDPNGYLAPAAVLAAATEDD
jgi:quercetin dioxygenase-like cupin family protein